MAVDDEPANAVDPSRPDEQVAEETAKAADDRLVAMADAGAAVIHEVDNVARDLASRATDAYAETTAATAKVFEEARERLNKAGAQALGATSPFGDGKLGQDLFGAMGQDYARASRGLVAFNERAFQAWKVNAEATVAHWQSLAGVKTWSEMIALNTAHARRQIETMTEQARDLADIAGRMTLDGSERAVPKTAER